MDDDFLLTACCEQLDGVLGDFVSYCLASAIRPQPILALAAGITMIGAVAGRRYRSPTNLRTNIYVVSAAESGAGKDHPRKCVAEALHKANLDHLIGGSKIASGAGLLSAMNREPSSIFQIDEFGQFLISALDQKHAPKHVADIWHYLTELFTSASSTFKGTEYANQLERKREPIEQPCCSVNGTTVPQPFWQALKSGSLFDGSFARWLLFQADAIPDEVKRPRKIGDVPEQLIAGLRAIHDGADGWVGRDTAAMGPIGDPQPFEVPYDDAAEKFFDRMATEMTARLRAAAGTNRAALTTRLKEHTIKLALIKAISTNPANPVIDLAAAVWAEGVVAGCTDRMFAEADNQVSDNETEAQSKLVLNAIRKAGEDGISGRDLARKTPSLDRKRRNEAIGGLIEAEFIRKEDGHTTPLGGRPGVRYWID